MAFSKTTLSLKGLFAKLSIHGTQPNNTLYECHCAVVMLSVEVPLLLC